MGKRVSMPQKNSKRIAELLHHSSLFAQGPKNKRLEEMAEQTARAEVARIRDENALWRPHGIAERDTLRIKAIVRHANKAKPHERLSSDASVDLYCDETLPPPSLTG